MKCWKYVNKTIGILSLLLIITLLIQFYLATSFTPSFVNKTETVISKVVLTYGEEKQDSRYREVSYTLVPFFLNRYGLLANIKFDSGESVKTQFLITFWPFNEYSIKFISKLVDKEQVRFLIGQNSIFYLMVGMRNFKYYQAMQDNTAMFNYLTKQFSV